MTSLNFINWMVIMDSRNQNNKILEDMNAEKIVEYTPAIVYSALVIVIGIVGNIFSIAYYGFKTHKTSTNILITALSTTDLIACIIFSDEIIELCFTIAFKNVIGCKIMYFTNHTIVFTSALILFLICLDRFQKICRRQSWQMTEKGAKIGIGVVIIFCVAISVRDLVILDVVQVNLTASNSNLSVTGYYCTHSRDNLMKPAVTVFQLLDFVIFIIVIPAMFILYSIVAREIFVQRKQKESHQHMEMTKSTSDSRHIEGSTDVSTLETSDSDVHEKSKRNPDQSAKRGIMKMVSEKFYGKQSYEVKENKNEKPSQKHEIDEQRESRKRRKAHADTIEKKIAIMMIATTAGSVLSFVPYFVVNLGVKRNSNTPEQEFSVGMQIALRSFMLNNAINPFIMCIFNSKFKQFVKDTLCLCRQ